MGRRGKNGAMPVHSALIRQYISQTAPDWLWVIKPGPELTDVDSPIRFGSLPRQLIWYLALLFSLAASARRLLYSRISHARSVGFCHASMHWGTGRRRRYAGVQPHLTRH